MDPEMVRIAKGLRRRKRGNSLRAIAAELAARAALLLRLESRDHAGFVPQLYRVTVYHSVVLRGSFKRHFIEPLHFSCRPIDTAGFHAGGTFTCASDVWKSGPAEKN